MIQTGRASRFTGSFQLVPSSTSDRHGNCDSGPGRDLGPGPSGQGRRRRRRTRARRPRLGPGGSNQPVRRVPAFLQACDNRNNASQCAPLADRAAFPASRLTRTQRFGHVTMTRILPEGLRVTALARYPGQSFDGPALMRNAGSGQKIKI